MKRLRLLAFSLIVFALFQSRAQEGIPIYYDYLTDNLFLIHPAMAGASSCSKVRLTGRMQWSGVEDFPMLQTLNVSSHLGKHSGFGIILYNDRNGYHSQKGLQMAFAHHLQLSQGRTLNQLSFGISGMYSFNQIDMTDFDPNNFDPAVANVMQSAGYFNIDVGLAWHVENFFFIASAKNLLLMSRPLYTPGLENNNLRNYVGSMGYFFGKREGFHFEPSVMFQYKEYSGEMIGDANLKFYQDMANGAFFWGVSYRNYLNQSVYGSLQDLTPFIGFYSNKFIISYVYTYQLAENTFSKGGFHQVSLGFNFDCRRREPVLGCPHIR